MLRKKRVCRPPAWVSVSLRSILMGSSTAERTCRSMKLIMYSRKQMTRTLVLWNPLTVNASLFEGAEISPALISTDPAGVVVLIRSPPGVVGGEPISLDSN
jgi:uncharacterized membrane protein